MRVKNSPKQSLMRKLSKLFLDIRQVQKADATASGQTYLVFTLADGTEVYVDQDGFATLDDEQMPAGEHALANGNILVIDEQGQFVETKIGNSELKENPIKELKQQISNIEKKLSEIESLAKKSESIIKELRKITLKT